ncbi:3-oxoacyl-[acyl-carrier-protein] synthase III C-terminal domain-containing protein [Micromonospora sp. C95]|uniref:3-oxoacyl-[acyl-carrier-protein] synthase III C-terminal domain-containing protein n=1 Tax=Micromonospora sp. C95 TaxID=2824882 RepID=UPI001B39AB32|nr:3-oxoacyl-[acyl-carrier-protein] synthase III C-terminal domain-containing protein [Micromonospora sp. C95]MBQ1026061.1 3-oxoacyl-ACP synthase [Micromonospora sp. C95]
MTVIEAVGGYLPPTRVRIGELLGRHGMKPNRVRMYERFFGFGEVPLDPDAGLVDLLVHTVMTLPAFEERRPLIRYVIQARTMPVVAPYPVNPLHEACRRLELEHATAFCLTQHACASGLLAIDVAGHLLAGDGEQDALALVVVGEKTFTSTPRLVNTTGVMGEGAAAILVRADGERDRVLGYASRTHGQYHAAGSMSPQQIAQFNEQYPDHLAAVILAAVENASLDLADIDLILPHNVGWMSWSRVLRSLGITGSERLFADNFAAYGHSFGADSFLNYRSACDAGRIRPGDRYLMTAVGLGATFAAMVLQH